jgi:hypothetical protein
MFFVPAFNRVDAPLLYCLAFRALFDYVYLRNLTIKGLINPPFFFHGNYVPVGRFIVHLAFLTHMLQHWRETLG